MENLTREAFRNVYAPGCFGHFVLHRYRSNPDFIPQLDLVMEKDGRIIGHVMYSKAGIVMDDGSLLPAWTFGPISVHPEFKRKGLGLRLLQHSMDMARGMGVGVICIEGDIGFYGHAGFVPASSLKMHYHAEPRDAAVPCFLARELIPGYLDGKEGTYHTPKGYYAAFEDPGAFERFEASFPSNVKAVQDGQIVDDCLKNPNGRQ